MISLEKLKTGDPIQNLGSGNTYTVKVDASGRVVAVREIEVSNPDEWVLVGSGQDEEGPVQVIKS